MDKIVELGWAGHHIDVASNMVYVELEDCTEANINRFKSEILSSPLIEFRLGSTVELKPNNDEMPKASRAFKLYCVSKGLKARNISAQGFNPGSS